MKKTNVFITTLILFVSFVFLFSFEANAQSVEVKDLGTISNSVLGASTFETGYLYLDKIKSKNGWTQIDSIVFALKVQEETDIDSFDVYPGFVQAGQTLSTAVFGTVTTFTVTLNVAAAGTGYERLLTSNAGYSGANLRGYNLIKYVTKGATAGNDPTDPNNGWAIAFVYGQ
jgi:hypothetical protein